MVLARPGGPLLFSHNYVPGARGFGSESRANLTVWASDDSGASWTFARQVDADPRVPAAYSALLPHNATHALLVYERGTVEPNFLNLGEPRLKNYQTLSLTHVPLPPPMPSPPPPPLSPAAHPVVAGVLAAAPAHSMMLDASFQVLVAVGIAAAILLFYVRRDRTLGPPRSRWRRHEDEDGAGAREESEPASSTASTDSAAGSAAASQGHELTSYKTYQSSEE